MKEYFWLISLIYSKQNNALWRSHAISSTYNVAQFIQHFYIPANQFLNEDDELPCHQCGTKKKISPTGIEAQIFFLSTKLVAT